MTEDDLRIMGVVKLICVVLIPCTVFVGVCSHSYRTSPTFLILVFNPVPSIAVVFVQRAVTSRSKLKGILRRVRLGNSQLLYVIAHGGRCFTW